MKIYNVTVSDANDATEEASFAKAKALLQRYPELFAVIYGYTKNGKTVYLVKPIECKSFADVKKYQRLFNDGMNANDIVLHTLFQREA